MDKIPDRTLGGDNDALYELQQRASGHVVYDFVKLGEGLATTLLKAAHEQVNKANQILEQTQSLADIIMTQVRAQASQIEDMNARFKSFGEQMLVAHRVLNGNVPVANPAAPSPDLAKLRALAGNYGGHVNPPAREPDGPRGNVGPGTHPVGVSRAPDPARQGGGLQHALADLDRFRVNKPHTREDHRDPSHDDLTGVDGNRAS